MPEPRYFEEGPLQPAGPDYLRKPPTTELSKEHEEDIARRSRGQRVRGSGNQPGNPGDVSGQRDLQELKATEKVDETRIQLSWLRKIAAQALAMGKYPVVSMRFTRLKPPTPRDWVLIPADVYHRLLEEQS